MIIIMIYTFLNWLNSSNYLLLIVAMNVCPVNKIKDIRRSYLRSTVMLKDSSL